MAEVTFEELLGINVNDRIEEKNGLKYLSWSYGWAEFKKHYPTATYSIWKDENGRPYAYDPLTGFMVYTSVTADGITHDMWLPVMDGANQAMKSEPYQYTVKRYNKEVTKTVQAATMFDINKTIMRCLVKNLAMFGLGLYIYSGEDLPEIEKAEAPANEEDEKQKKLEQEAALKAKVIGYVNRHKMSKENIEKLCRAYKVNSLNEMTAGQCQHYIEALNANGGNIDE